MEDNETVDEMLCEAVEKIYVKSPLVRNLYVIELVAVFLGAAVALFMAVIIFRSKTLHFNARLLLITFCLSTAITNIGIEITFLVKLILLKIFHCERYHPLLFCFVMNPLFTF